MTTFTVVDKWSVVMPLQKILNGLTETPSISLEAARHRVIPTLPDSQSSQEEQEEEQEEEDFEEDFEEEQQLVYSDVLPER